MCCAYLNLLRRDGVIIPEDTRLLARVLLPGAEDGGAARPPLLKIEPCFRIGVHNIANLQMTTG